MRWLVLTIIWIILGVLIFHTVPKVIAQFGQVGICVCGTTTCPYPDYSPDPVGPDTCGALCSGLGGGGVLCDYNGPSGQSCSADYGWCQSWNGCLAGGNVINNQSFECSGFGEICCRQKQCTDVSGARCSKIYTSCAQTFGSNYMDYNNGTLDSTCSSGLAQCCVQKPNCNGGAVYSGWSVCGGYPANTCYNGNGSQSRTCTLTTYNGSSTCIQQACATQYQSCTGNNCFANYTCSGGNCLTSIYAYVYTDYNHTGSNNGGPMNGVTVSDNGGNTPTTGSNGWNPGEVIFSQKATGSYTITATAPTNYYPTSGSITTSNGNTYSSNGVSLTNTSGNVTTNFYMTPLYSISGTVFYDANHDGKYDGTDPMYTQGTITISGGPSPVSPITLNGTGVWSTPTNLEAGNYTVTYSSGSLPAGYSMTTSQTWNVTVGNPNGSIKCQVGGSPDGTCGGTNNGSISNLNFGIDYPYQISGTVFNDINLDTHYNNPPDTPYTNSPVITINGAASNKVVVNTTATANASDGTYTTGQTLPPGTYTVTITGNLPTGYTYTTPTTYQVIIGYNPACNTGGSPDGTCGAPNNGGSIGAGSVSNLNFGVTNENSWTQVVCLDGRNDSGSYTNLIPPAPSCGGVNGPYNSVTNADCTNSAGIQFTCTATPDYGNGSASTNGWQAGGPTAQQQECFKNQGLNVIRTSYNYLLTTLQQSGITPIDLSTVCTGGVGNCTLPANLAKGVYQANGNLTLNSYTFPQDGTPEGFIFLINGKLTITGNILVPRGSVAAFSSSGDIEVLDTVGQTVNATTLADGSVNDPNLEGLYSADVNFIVDSKGSATAVCNPDGTPLDLKLNIIGSVVTNAAQQGGSLINNRNLCIYDNQCSSISGGDGNPDSNGSGGGATGGSGDEGLSLSYILTLYADGKLLTHQVFNWQELKP